MGSAFYGGLRPGSKMVAVVMAGGSGVRFWPASRKALPKQLLSLTNSGRTMLEDACERMRGVGPECDILIVTAESQRSRVQEILPGVSILSEPYAKNTAMCIAYASALVLKTLGDVPILFVTADHVFGNPSALQETLRVAVEAAAKSDNIITIGIRPECPETGYGYIRQGAQSSVDDRLFEVKQFVEKPNLETAKEYLSSGGYFWNSGLFTMRPSVFLKSLRSTLPKHAEAIDLITEAFGKPDEFEQIAEAFGGVESISVDYGVIEKIHNILLLPGEDFLWSDIGHWKTWAESQAPTADHNRNTKTGEAILIDCENVAVRSTRSLVACLGVKDLIIVETGDAVLVVHPDRAQDVRKIVEELERQGRTDLL